MADTNITGLQIQVGLDTGKFVSEGVKLNATAKQITESFNKISGLKAGQQLDAVAKSVERMGGVANLSAPQVARLRVELDKLAAAGIKIPKALQLPKIEGGKLGLALKDAGLSSLQGQAAAIGPLGGVLAGLGPAGLAGAAGIGAVTAAAGAAAAVTFSLIKGLSETSSHLVDLNAQTGLSTDFLQEAAFAGKLVGVSLEDIASASSKLAQNIGQGDKVFEQLGLSLEKLRALKPDEQFVAVANAIKSIQDPTVQAAAAVEAFGKGGVQILPLIRSDFAAAAEEARKMGLVLSSDVVKAGDEVDDALTRLSAQFDALKSALAAEFVTSGGAIEGLKALSEILLGVVAIIPTAVTGIRTLVDVAQATIPGLSTLLSGAGAVVDKLREIGRQSGAAAGAARAALGVSTGTAGAQTGPSRFDPAAEKAAAAAKKLGEERKRAAEEAQRAEEKYFKAVADGIQKQFDAFAKLRTAREQSSLSLESKLTGGASEANLQAAQLQAQIIDQLGVKAEGSAEGLREIDKAMEDFVSSLSTSEVENLVEEFDKLRKAGADIPQGLGVITDKLNELAFEEAAAKANEFDGEMIELFKTLASVGQGPFAGFSPDAIDAAFGRVTEGAQEATKVTFDWAQSLENVANLLASIGGLGSGLGKILGGISGIGAALQQFKGLGGLKDALGGKNGLGGILAGIGGIGSIAGAAFGIGKTLFGGIKKLFGGKSDAEKAAEAGGKILGRAVSKEMGEEVVRRAKETGKSIEQVFKEIKTDELREKFSDLQGRTSSAVGQIGSGLAAFGSIKGAAEAQGRIFGAQFAAVVKAEGFDKALDLFKDTFSKLPDNIKQSVPADIQKLFTAGDNEQFAAAVDAGSAFAESFKGTVGLIGLSTQTMADFGQVAQATFDQAKAGAIEAGLTQEEAQRSALQAVVPLLSEMQSAAKAAGQALDPATQGLINQADAAGISIPIDPLIEVADLLREMLNLQRELAGLPPLAPKVDTSQLAQAPPAAEAAGQETGARFADGMGRGIDAGSEQVQDAIKKAGDFEALEDAAKEAAEGVEKGLNPAVGKLEEIRKQLKDLDTLVVTPEVRVTGGDVPGGGEGAPPFASGGIFRASKSGSLAELHGLEAVLPLDKKGPLKKVLAQVFELRPAAMAEAFAEMTKAPPRAVIPRFDTGGIFAGAGTSLAGDFGTSPFGSGSGVTIGAPQFNVSVDVTASGSPAAIGEAVAEAIEQEVPVIMDAFVRTIRTQIEMSR